MTGSAKQNQSLNTEIGVYVLLKNIACVRKDDNGSGKQHKIYTKTAGQDGSAVI